MAKVELAAGISDPLYGGSQKVAEPVSRPAPPASAIPESETAADFRLVIEEGESEGRYIYTVINRTTGEVVSMLPREEVLKLRDDRDYQAGALFSGTI